MSYMSYIPIYLCPTTAVQNTAVRKNNIYNHDDDDDDDDHIMI